MLSKSERTLRMKEAFISLHKQGLTLKQIAHRFDLDSSTVYAHLQEIADAAGVPRESLLQFPHSPHLTYERRFEPAEPIDIEAVHAHFVTISDELNQTLIAISQQISQSLSVSDQIAKEEASWQ